MGGALTAHQVTQGTGIGPLQCGGLSLGMLGTLRTLELPSQWETKQSCVDFPGTERATKSVPLDDRAKAQAWQGQVWVCFFIQLPQRRELPWREERSHGGRGL